MNNRPTLDNTRLDLWAWLLFNLLFYVPFFGLIGPVAGLLSLQWARRPFSAHPGRLLLVGLALGWLVWLVRTAPSNEDPLLALAFLWAMGAPLYPLAGTLFKGFRMFSYFLKPKTLAEQLKDEERWRREHQDRLSSRAGRRRESDGQAGTLRLGAFVKGDLFPAHIGIYNERGWLWLDEPVLDQHLFVLGATGAGKSETIKRLVHEILSATERDVYFVDGKGDEGLAADIRGLAHHHGRGQAPIFRLGFDQGGAIYDAFRGQPADIYNRLCALVGVHEAEGDARYYADINRDLLQLICYAPGGPPRDFATVRARLDREWLLDAYRDDEVEHQTLREMDKRDIEGLARRIRPLAREFGRCVGTEGFALEETRCAIFCLRAQSVGDTARRFLDFLVEDLKDFVGKRQQRPAVLVIDEFGQFSNANVIALLTLARSSKLGVILATQDTASLKDEVTKRQVLANTRTKLLMASDFPEEVGALAGTIYQIEASIQHQEGNPTGMGSSRIQHAFKVDMNEAAQLQPGEGFLIRQRYSAKLKVRAIGEVAHVEDQPEEQRTPSTSSQQVAQRRRPPQP